MNSNHGQFASALGRPDSANHPLFHYSLNEIFDKILILVQGNGVEAQPHQVRGSSQIIVHDILLTVLQAQQVNVETRLQQIGQSVDQLHDEITNLSAEVRNDLIGELADVRTQIKALTDRFDRADEERYFFFHKFHRLLKTH